MPGRSRNQGAHAPRSPRTLQSSWRRAGCRVEFNNAMLELRKNRKPRPSERQAGSSSSPAQGSSFDLFPGGHGIRPRDAIRESSFKFFALTIAERDSLDFLGDAIPDFLGQTKAILHAQLIDTQLVNRRRHPAFSLKKQHRSRISYRRKREIETPSGLKAQGYFVLKLTADPTKQGKTDRLPR